MCELFGWNSSKAARPERYLVAFRARGGATADHVDGWGLAWLNGGALRIEKEPEPAAGSARFAALAGTIASDLVVGHVRKANFPPVRSLANTHPFAQECCGATWVFAHNGVVPGAVEQSKIVEPGLCRAQGDTDSEHAFCLVLEALAGCHAPAGMQRAACFDTLAGAARELAQLGKFNFLLSDGERLYAYCYDRLHVLESAGAGERSVAIATQPLSDEPWQALEPGELRVYRNGGLISSPPADRRRATRESHSPAAAPSSRAS
jgi:glutamine amidotransferase